jgi:hypothetical protein
MLDTADNLDIVRSIMAKAYGAPLKLEYTLGPPNSQAPAQQSPSPQPAPVAAQSVAPAQEQPPLQTNESLEDILANTFGETIKFEEI